jgi:hypothetical protein
MPHRGVAPWVNAVTGDLAAGLCGQVPPQLRGGDRHLTLVSPSASVPVPAVAEIRAQPPSADLDALLEELGRNLEKLAQLQPGVRRFRLV